MSSNDNSLPCDNPPQYCLCKVRRLHAHLSATLKTEKHSNYKGSAGESVITFWRSVWSGYHRLHHGQWFNHTKFCTVVCTRAACYKRPVTRGGRRPSHPLPS